MFRVIRTSYSNPSRDWIGRACSWLVASITLSLQRPWPLLPPGEYHGVVREVQVGPAPFPPRKPRPGESEWRKDWHVYVHVALLSALTDECAAALTDYQRKHGSPPIVFYACRYETRPLEATSLPVRRSSKLHALLLLTEPTNLTEVSLDALLGFSLRVRLRNRTDDPHGDRKPQALHHSVIDKILEATAPAGKSSASSEQTSARSHEPGATSTQQSSETNFPGESSPRFRAAGTDRSSSVRPLTDAERNARLRQFFGTTEGVTTRGPCPHCRATRYAGPGTMAKCLHCDWSP
jgi:hypothetical protein